MTGFYRITTQANRRERGTAGYTQRARKRDAAMRQLVRKYGGRCALCNELVSFKAGEPTYATIDHVRPISKGGLDVPSNWQLACDACNQAKGDTWDEPA